MYGCAIGEASSAMMPTGIKSSAQSQLEPVLLVDEPPSRFSTFVTVPSTLPKF